jgi:hypothetical protein
MNERKPIMAQKEVTAKPFQGKVYGLTDKFSPASEDFASAPKQVRGIMRYMHDKKVKGRGGDICQAAIKEGYVKSKIDPPVLFAYYARKMESLGMELVEINVIQPKTSKTENKGVRPAKTKKSK